MRLPYKVWHTRQSTASKNCRNNKSLNGIFDLQNHFSFSGPNLKFLPNFTNFCVAKNYLRISQMSVPEGYPKFLRTTLEIFYGRTFTKPLLMLKLFLLSEIMTRSGGIALWNFKKVTVVIFRQYYILHCENPLHWM